MFDNRLIKLREEMGKSKKEVAEALNMPYNTYSNYEGDLREPNSEVLIQIADFYNVSIDYLLGLTDIKSVNIDLQTSCKYTGLSEKAINFIHNLNPKESDNQYGAFNLKNMLNALNELLSSDNIEKILTDLAYYFFVNFELEEKTAFIAKIKSVNSEQKNELIFTPKAIEMALLYEIQECIKDIKKDISGFIIYDMEKAIIDNDMIVPESEKEKYKSWKTFQKLQSIADEQKSHLE